MDCYHNQNKKENLLFLTRILRQKAKEDIYNQTTPPQILKK